MSISALERLSRVMLAAFAATLLQQSATAQTQDAPTLLPAAVSKTSENDGFNIQIGQHGEVTLVTDGSTRREMLERLLAGRGVEIIWRNQAFAEEKIVGRFSGRPSDVARRLFTGGNSLVTYGTGGGEYHISRIVVFGSDRPSVTQTTQVAPRGHASSPQGYQETATDRAVRRNAVIEARRREAAQRPRPQQIPGSVPR